MNAISYLQGLKREDTDKKTFLLPPWQTRPFALVQELWYQTSNNFIREGSANYVKYRGLATVQIPVCQPDVYRDLWCP